MPAEAASLFIHGVGHFRPENIIDNQFLEQLDIGVDVEWVLVRTGIRTRHTVLPLDYIRDTRNRDVRAAGEVSLYSNAETGCHAAQMAIAKAGLTPSDIGMVIAGGSAPSLGSPAEACLIAARLGLSVPAFDLNSACTTWAVQLNFLSLMRPEALPDFVLLVTAENMTRTVDYLDRMNAILMGDCTVATVVSTRVKGPLSVRTTAIESSPSAWDQVVIPSAGHMRQTGGPVQSFAIRKMVSTLEKLRAQARPHARFIGHQANLTMLNSVCERAGIAPQDHWFNLDASGHCGGAGAPSVLSERLADLRPGEQVMVATVGAGMTWAGTLLERTEEGQR